MYKRLSMNGVNLDVDPIEYQGQFWSAAGNMVPRPRHMERSGGWSQELGTPLFGPYFLQYSPQLGDPYWVYCGATAIATIDEGQAHAVITPAAMTNPVNADSWTGGNLNGIAVVNAIENKPYYWFEGMPTALELPGLRANTNYKIMRPYKYHLVGLGYKDLTGEYQDGLHWSDAADPGNVPQTWIATPDNEAGSNILADENGAIVDGLALRDGFMIYKQDSVYEMNYIGGNAVMSFRKVFGTTGILAANCVVEVNGHHIVLGNGDLYRHDGQNVASICDGVIRDAFFSQIDPDNFANSFAVYLEPRDEVWFCVPQVGQDRPNLALVWHVPTEAFGYRELPACDYIASGILPGSVATVAWEDETRTWTTVGGDRWKETSIKATEDGVVMADAVGVKLFQGNTGVTADGVSYASYVEVYGVDLDDPHRLKSVRRVWPRINAPDDMLFKIEMFAQKDPQSPVQRVDQRDFINTGEGVPLNGNGRYLGFKLSTQQDIPWQIAGLDIEYMPRGRF